MGIEELGSRERPREHARVALCTRYRHEDPGKRHRKLPLVVPPVLENAPVRGHVPPPSTGLQETWRNLPLTTGPWQRMLSGRRLDLLNPSPLDIEIEDIAHGLARVARWNGQTKGAHAFSVAQHSAR